MSGETLQFGRVPRDLIVSGTLATSGADRVEMLVLLGIAAHADGEFQSCPSMTTLAKCAGITERSARRAICRLERRGVVHVDRAAGGRHKTSTYTIYPDAQSVLVSGAIPGRPECPGKEGETRTLARRNPDANTPKPGRSRRPPNRGTEGTEARPALPGITPPPAAAYTFAATAGPWSLTVGQRDKLRDEFWNLHVDTELAALAAWTEANPGKRKAPGAMHGWLRACLARKQAERPLFGPASYPGWFHASLPTDPTAEELDAMLAGAESEDSHAD